MGFGLLHRVCIIKENERSSYRDGSYCRGIVFPSFHHFKDVSIILIYIYILVDIGKLLNHIKMHVLFSSFILFTISNFNKSPTGDTYLLA